jgi:hypothetical protein
MDTTTSITRINESLEPNDHNWIIDSVNNIVINSVESEETARFSLSIRDDKRSYLYGRFEIDIPEALKEGIIDRELRSNKPRIRIECIAGRYYVKRIGAVNKRLKLMPKSNIVRLDMRHAYRWGFNRQTA